MPERYRISSMPGATLHGNVTQDQLATELIQHMQLPASVQHWAEKKAKKLSAAYEKLLLILTG